MHIFEFHRHCKLCQLVVNLRVELCERGVNSVSYVFLLLSLCILIDKYAMFCIFFANWHSLATLTEVCPCFYLSREANARV